MAAVKNLTQDLERLIIAGASVDSPDKNGGTPLHKVAYTGTLEAVKILLRHKANVNATDAYGWTPLFWAARGKHVEVIRCLLSNNAELSIKNNSGQDALHVSAAYGNAATSQFLLQEGTKNNPLKHIIAKNAIDCCEKCRSIYNGVKI